ncbi:MAG: efflux RND transporter periplasmic adaptor subunit [Candidatus Cloacimonetes bacterium]|nr:efflux RND transporter periplasmic adaptor subunit [Candidatus Cloacimonadota bacterium]
MKYKLSLLVAIIGLLSCSGKEKAEVNTPVESAVEKKISVLTEVIKKTDLTGYTNVTGVLEGINDVMIISEVNGKLNKLYRKLGDQVSAGDTIGVIDNEVIKLQLDQLNASIASAQVAYDNSVLFTKTSAELLEKESISQTEYDQALIQMNGAKAQLDGLAATKRQLEKQLESSLITAPVGGFISDLPVTSGNYVNMGTPLCRIVDSGKFIIRTGVGESEIGAVKRGMVVKVASKNSSKIYNGLITGKGIAKVQTTGCYPLEIELSNDGDLYVGMIVTVSLKSSEYKNVFAISMNSIAKEFDKEYVMKIKDDTIYRTEIQTGKSVSGLTIVEKGLNEGDMIVWEGIESVQEGMKVSRKMRNGDL